MGARPRDRKMGLLNVLRVERAPDLRDRWLGRASAIGRRVRVQATVEQAARLFDDIVGSNVADDHQTHVLRLIPPPIEVQDLRSGERLDRLFVPDDGT